MESQPQNPEFRINPENFHPCIPELWVDNSCPDCTSSRLVLSTSLLDLSVLPGNLSVVSWQSVASYHWAIQNVSPSAVLKPSLVLSVTI